MTYMLLLITKTTKGANVLSISPFLVIDENIWIKATTYDIINEYNRRFEKYVISKSSP